MSALRESFSTIAAMVFYGALCATLILHGGHWAAYAAPTLLLPYAAWYAAMQAKEAHVRFLRPITWATSRRSADGGLAWPAVNETACFASRIKLKPVVLLLLAAVGLIFGKAVHGQVIELVSGSASAAWAVVTAGSYLLIASAMLYGSELGWNAVSSQKIPGSVQLTDTTRDPYAGVVLDGAFLILSAVLLTAGIVRADRSPAPPSQSPTVSKSLNLATPAASDPVVQVDGWPLETPCIQRHSQDFEAKAAKHATDPIITLDQMKEWAQDCQAHGG